MRLFIIQYVWSLSRWIEHERILQQQKLLHQCRARSQSKAAVYCKKRSFLSPIQCYGVNTNWRFFTNARCVRVMVGPTTLLDRERSVPRSRPFFWRVKFLRLDSATLTDAPAEEIVPRNASRRARAIVCMKNRCDVP